MKRERITVVISPQQKVFVEARIAGGEFGNVSEYVRDLIRHDQQRRALKAVEALVIEGIESGRAGKFNDEKLREYREFIDRCAKEKPRAN